MSLHKSQILFLILLVFWIGVATGSFWQMPREWFVGALTLGGLILAASAYHKTFGPTAQGIARRKIGFIAGFLILVAVAGIWRVNSFQAKHSVLAELADRVAGLVGKEKSVQVTLNGYVDGDFISQANGGQFPFKVKEVIVSNRLFLANERVLVQSTNFPRYRYGEMLTLAGAVKTPKNFSDFDYVAYLKKDGIRVILTVQKASPLVHLIKINWLERFKVGLYKNIMVIRDNFQLALERSLAEPVASYAAGILLGTRQNLPAEVKEAFNRTGTSHILAISGYNISIIAEILLWLAAFLVPRRKALLPIIATLILFTVMTGASASVVRAAVMGTLLVLATSIGRLYDVKNSIILAGAVMLWSNPLALRFDVGFQLSFLAVLGIIFLQPILERWLEKIKTPMAARQILGPTLAAQIAVLPLLAYSFNTISLLALPANFLILPFVPIAMIMAFATGVAGMVLVQLGRIIGTFTWALASYQIGVAKFLAGFSFAILDVAVGAIPLVLAYVILAGAVYWFSRKIKTN